MLRRRGKREVHLTKAQWIDEDNLEKLLQNQIRTQGIFSKKTVERLESFSIHYRPFKRITLNIVGRYEKDIVRKESMIDAELAPFIDDVNHRMLLWRPKYINYEMVNDLSIEEPVLDLAAVQSSIDEMVEQRWQAQDFDEEVRPKLRRLQADPLSAISIFLPRTPGGLRKEKNLIEDRKSSRALILATSLVTNTDSKEIITSADIGSTVFVETITATFREDDGSYRFLVLETPGTNSIGDAVKSGRALTRLCELYVECREIVANTPK